MSIYSCLAEWLSDELGQDVQEYTLLLAFVVLVSAALFLCNGGSISAIWSSTESCLAAPSGS
jgi:Flp pilus assembly pilin Flp